MNWQKNNRVCLSADVPTTFCVTIPVALIYFVSASKEARIERLMHIHHISTEAAEELMEKADKKRSAYYNYYSYKTWGAAETYHLCIDSSVLGIDGTVQFIKQFVKLKLGF